MERRNRKTEKQLLILILILLILNLSVLPFTLRYNIDNEKKQVLSVTSSKIKNNDQAKFLLKQMDTISRFQNQYEAEYIKLNNCNLELAIKDNSSNVDTTIKNINEIIDIEMLNLLNNSNYINIKGRVK